MGLHAGFFLLLLMLLFLSFEVCTLKLHPHACLLHLAASLAEARGDMQIRGLLCREAHTGNEENTIPRALERSAEDGSSQKKRHAQAKCLAGLTD